MRPNPKSTFFFTKNKIVNTEYSTRAVQCIGANETVFYVFYKYIVENETENKNAVFNVFLVFWFRFKNVFCELGQIFSDLDS